MIVHYPGMIPMTANLESPIPWTRTDLELLPDNGNRYEIIDGNLYMTRSPHFFHQNAAFKIGMALELWSAKQNHPGKVSITPGLIFGDADNVIPDLVWISSQKLATGIDESGHLITAPELVVEVLSQTPQDIRRDKELKLKLYSQQGVQEYWIVDWQAQEVMVYRRSQARLVLVCTLFAIDSLSSPLFPDFDLKIADIFL